MDPRLSHHRLALSSLAVVALVGCGAHVVVDGTSSSAGAGGTGGTAGTAGVGGTSGTGGAGGVGLTPAQCTCACTTLMSAGGCADLCDDKQNGQAGTPNWCNGAAALSQCAACLGSKCSIDPTDQEAQSSCM